MYGGRGVRAPLRDRIRVEPMGWNMLNALRSETAPALLAAVAAAVASALRFLEETVVALVSRNLCCFS
jgi:hypothetical protein